MNRIVSGALVSLCLLPVFAQGPANAPETLAPPRLDPALASFGALIQGDRLFVYGGHIGRRHQHSTGNLSARFQSIDISPKGGPWREENGGRPLQGLALVSDGRTIIRIGGLQALNRPGEPEDLRSDQRVEAWDSESGLWTNLPDLPEPRSSHDAALLGRRIYVFGGWNIQGPSRTWAKSGLVFDLDRPDEGWRLEPQPFERRAVAVATSQGRIYVLGGLGTDHEPSTELNILNPADGTWQKGPDYPTSAFGIAAVDSPLGLLACGADGVLRRYNPETQQWVHHSRLIAGRIFHRLLLHDDEHLLVVGGSRDDGHVAMIERHELTPVKPFVVVRGQMPFHGVARQRQVIRSDGYELHFRGGNLRSEAHQFEDDDFTQQGLAIHLLTGKERPIPDFPVKRQSMALSETNEKTLILGGFGPAEKAARSSADVFVLTRESGEITKLELTLPIPLTQAGVVNDGRDTYIYGGLDYDPSRGEELSFRHVRDVLRFDSDAGEFRQIADLPRPRRAAGVAHLDGKVYLVGGLADGFQSVTTIDVHHLESNTWSTCSAPPKHRSGGDLVALGGRLYYGAGSVANETGPPTIEVFDPATSTWSTLLELPGFPRRETRLLVVKDHLVLLTTVREGVLEFAAIRPFPQI